MQKLFNKILIPVDLSSGSLLTIEKAMPLAQQYHCSIHLLHVVTIDPLLVVAIAESHTVHPFNTIANIEELENKLTELCNRFTQIPGNKVNISYSVISGAWDIAVIDFVKQHEIDLLIIEQRENIFRKKRMFLNPDTIAEKTKIAVISMPLNKRLIRLYSIVIPVTHFVPVKKLIYGIYMAFSFNCTIKLVGVVTANDTDNVYLYLVKSQKIIQENCDVRVEIATVVGQNVAAATNQFALHHSADLIILNPGIQTKMPGWFSSWWGNIIQKHTNLPVLTISAF